MKKFMSFALCLILVFIMAVPVSASQLSEAEMDVALLDRGFPADYIDLLSIQEKEEIYSNPNIFYLDSFAIHYSESDNARPTGSNEDNIQPYGQIPTSDLSMWFYITCTMDYDFESIAYIHIKFSYKWNNLPLCRYQDPIAVSWDGTKFRLQDNSFIKCDQYSAQILNGDGSITELTNQIHSYDTGFASSSDNGVSWYADLKGYGTSLVLTSLYGYGSFTLVPAPGVTIPEWTQTTLYARYVHQTGTAGITVGVPDYGVITISGGTGYDERATQKTFYIANTAG